MTVRAPLADIIRRGALSPRFAKFSIPADCTHELCVFAAKAHDTLAAIALACRRADNLDTSINPKGLLAFLADQNLILEEMTDEQFSEPAA